MHPAAASAGDASLPGDRRVPDLSPANMGGRGDRNGSLLGSAKVVTRAPPRESLWAVAPGGPAALLPLACPALCSQTFTPRRLRADGKDERARRVAAAAAALAPALGVLARAGDGGADVATLDALAAVDAPRLIALVLPSALDAMRRVHASSNGGSQHGHGGVERRDGCRLGGLHTRSRDESGRRGGGRGRGTRAAARGGAGPPHLTPTAVHAPLPLVRAVDGRRG